MRMLFWLLAYAFTPPSRRSEQMRLDWNWFWKVDLAYWWFTTPVYRFVERLHRWLLSRNDADDGFPF